MSTRRHTAWVAAIAMAAVALPAALAAAAAPWSPVSTLSTMPVTNTEEPAVVTDTVGNAVAVWIGSTGVEAASRPAGGGWSAPETLSDTAAVTGPPQVAVNDVGTVTVAWIEDGAVQVVNRSNPGTWTVPEPISGGASGGLDLDVTGAGGRTALVWRTPELVVYGVVGAASGGGWETPVALSNEALFAADPSVGFDSAGRATAVWAEGATFATNDTIESSVHPLGGEWAAAVQVSGAGVRFVTEPTLAVSASGSATVAWSAGPEAIRNKAVIQAVSRALGGPWTAPQDLSDPLLNAFTPKVAMNSDGDTVVVWNQEGDRNKHTQAVHRPSGGSWGEVADLSDQGSRSFGDTIVVVADDGAATAAWEFDDSGTAIIQAARMSPSGAWSAPIDVTDTSVDRTRPALAIDGPGNVTAVFMARPDDFQVESASLDTTGPTVGSLGIPAGGIVGQAVSFFATASDLWSSVASYSWTFGDGASADGPAPSHAYVAPGSYPVSVTVTDTAGNTTTRGATTTVTAASAPLPQPPPKQAPEITVFKVHDIRIQGIARAAADAPEKTKLKVRLTAAARLRLVLTSEHRHLVDGKHKYVKVTLTRRLPAGRSSVTLKGRLATIKLLPDTYRIVGTATNTIGSSSAHKTRLVVVAPSDHSFQTKGQP